MLTLTYLKQVKYFLMDLNVNDLEKLIVQLLLKLKSLYLLDMFNLIRKLQ